MHKFLGPVLEKVHFDPQVRQLRDGFNVMCEIAFQLDIVNRQEFISVLRFTLTLQTLSHTKI